MVNERKIFDVEKFKEENQLEVGWSFGGVAYALFPYIILPMLLLIPSYGWLAFAAAAGGLFGAINFILYIGKNNVKDSYGAAFNLLLILFNKMLDWELVLIRKIQNIREIPIPENIKKQIIEDCWNQIHSAEAQAVVAGVSQPPPQLQAEIKVDPPVNGEKAKSNVKKGNDKKPPKPLMNVFQQELLNITKEELTSYLDSCHATLCENEKGEILGIQHSYPFSTDFPFKKKQVETVFGDVYSNVAPGFVINPGVTYDIPNPTEDLKDEKKNRLVNIPILVAIPHDIHGTRDRLITPNIATQALSATMMTQITSAPKVLRMDHLEHELNNAIQENDRILADKRAQRREDTAIEMGEEAKPFVSEAPKRPGRVHSWFIHHWRKLLIIAVVVFAGIVATWFVYRVVLGL